MASAHELQPFCKGECYRVVRDFSAWRDSFRAGEVLRYLRWAYSRYDNMGGFFFVDVAGQLRSWDLADDEAVDGWGELFAPCSPATAAETPPLDYIPGAQ